jgi:hypothetical protein
MRKPLVNSELMRRVRFQLNGPLQSTAESSLLLLGRMASQQVRAMQNVYSLSQVEFKVSSQWGEDGIIDWLVERARLPARLHTFVEFGVESYLEANTRFLLQNRNWRGLVIDRSSLQINLLRKRDSHLFCRYDLTASSAHITRENINQLLASAGFSGDIGLLSIDIDGNDYWVWEAVDVVRPVICICEYNAVFGDVWPLSIPYDENFVRTRPEFHSLYFGTSIAALRCLAKRKGYQFVGTNSEGVNAFFVREDYALCFDALIENPAAQPSRIRESRNADGLPSFARGLDRVALIQDLPVINTETQEELALKSINPLYSEEWSSILEAKSAGQAAYSR